MLTFRGLLYFAFLMISVTEYPAHATEHGVPVFSPEALADKLTPQCFYSAGLRYRLDPLLLYAIAQVESRMKSRAVNRNRNGTVDYGVMQINSIHLPWLKRHGVDARRLLNEPCTAVYVGASILAGMIDRLGYSWEAVGAYNAGVAPSRAAARRRYAHKVWVYYQSLLGAR